MELTKECLSRALEHRTLLHKMLVKAHEMTERQFLLLAAELRKAINARDAARGLPTWLIVLFESNVLLQLEDRSAFLKSFLSSQRLVLGAPANSRISRSVIAKEATFEFRHRSCRKHGSQILVSMG